MTYRLLIDGGLVDGGGMMDVVDPALSEVFVTCARTDAAKLDEAVAAAKRAFPAWVSQLHRERADIVLPGVLDVVADANLGDLLAALPDVAKIAFTGSTATGREVARNGADRLARLTLELGNDAAEILDDLDVAAERKVFDAAIFDCGQVCVAAKRIYAPRGMYDALCNEPVRLTQTAVVDGRLNQGAGIGPLQNNEQRDKVLAIIEDSRRCGTIIAGGQCARPEGVFHRADDCARYPGQCPARPRGTVRTCRAGTRLRRHRRCDRPCEQQRIRAARLDMDIGLPRRRSHDAHRVHARYGSSKYLDLPEDVSFGGVKQSGLGREKRLEDLHEYMQVKVINIAKTAAAA